MPDGSIGTVQRAYSLLTIKSVDEEKRIIEGIASTPTTDRMGDIVEPKGANYKLPLPLLWQHNSSQPIGQVLSAKVTAEGISIKAQIAKGVLPMIDDAWALIKAGLVRGLSIGFAPIEYNFMKDGGIRFEKWDWYELSAVTIPANAEASIQTIKSLDEQQRAASGHNSAVVRLSPAGVSAPETPKGKIMPTFQEQVTSFEAKRAADCARMDELLKLSSDEGRTLEESEQQEYDQLKAETVKIDKHLPMLRDAVERAKSSAVPVVPNKDVDTPNNNKSKQGEGVIRANANLPAGIGMARYVKAFAFAKGNFQAAAEYAKQWDTSTPEVAMALKTAVSAGTTSDSVWAGPLVYAQDFPAAFLEYLRPRTIIGKINGMSRVPFNIRYGIQDGGSTVGWVGQGAPKPVSKPTFTSGSLGFAKAAGIVVITQELARFSSPSAELKIRDDLTNQMVYFLDQQFIDPGVAAVSNVSPASVLNGATNVRQAANAWTSMANVLTDCKVLLSTFAANEISLQGAYWVMTPDTALSLGLLLNTGGTAFAFPQINVNGGNFLGLEAIVSNSVPHSTSAGAIVALVVPQWIYMADDGAVVIDTSTEASLQMDTAPTVNSATPTATSLVSMFQTNSIAVRVERVINWSRARTYGVGYIDNMHTS